MQPAPQLQYPVEIRVPLLLDSWHPSALTKVDAIDPQLCNKPQVGVAQIRRMANCYAHYLFSQAGAERGHPLSLRLPIQAYPTVAVW